MKIEKLMSHVSHFTSLVSRLACVGVVFLMLLSTPASVLGQDTVAWRPLSPAWEPLAGAAIFSTGALITLRPELHNVEIDLRDRLHLADLPPAHFDNILLFVPLATPFVLNIAGLEGEHNLGQTALLAGTSSLIGLAIIETCKFFYSTERPDGTSFNSFPSGHTFIAFTGAEILRREYGSDYPWIAVAGYSVAAIVGLMRIYNNRHWFSDVVGGTGVALLSVSASYALWGAGKSKTNTYTNETITPLR